MILSTIIASNITMFDKLYNYIAICFMMYFNNLSNEYFPYHKETTH